MYIDKKKLWIQILAIIGIGLSVELAIIYYNANFNTLALSSFCSINDFIDCDTVAKSMFSHFLGIPLAYWGIFFYITVLFLTFVDKLKNISYLKFLEVFKEPKAYISTLGTIAFLCSMILAGISLIKIQKICILCVVTYFIDFIIAVIASDGLFKNIVKNLKTTIFDFIDGAKNYTKTFIILVLIATAFLCYSGISLQFVPHIKRHKEVLKFRKMKVNPYRVKGNVLGNTNGDVVIELYSDYVCPLCYTHNIMLHKAAQEFSNIKIVHHNYPFDKICNPNIRQTMHPNACFMSKGAIAAGKQGNYWEMSSLLYENQPKKIEDLLKLADKLGFDKELFIKDFHSSATEKQLKQEIDEASALEIDATPTMIINGETIVGVKPYSELKNILIGYGAKQK